MKKLDYFTSGQALIDIAECLSPENIAKSNAEYERFQRDFTTRLNELMTEQQGKAVEKAHAFGWYIKSFNHKTNNVLLSSGGKIMLINQEGKRV